MDRFIAIRDLEAQLKRLSVYCPAGLKLKAQLRFYDVDTVQIWMTDGHSNAMVPDSEALERSDAEILQLLRRAGFPIYTDAECASRIEKIADERKRRHVEQVRANNKRISERRRELREKRHDFYRNSNVSSFNCAVCGTAMTPVRRSKLYCSDRCRQRGHRAFANDHHTSTGRKKQQKASAK